MKRSALTRISTTGSAKRIEEAHPSGKCFSLSVTTTQSFASAIVATTISNALLGRPEAVPSAMR
jgi:hypothetical protein